MDQPDASWVFKRFHDRVLAKDPRRQERLEAMLRVTPQTTVDARGHVAVAWPIDTVEEDGRFVGFVMPRINRRSAVELHRIANPTDREVFAGRFTWDYLVATARNLTHAVGMLHAAGVVIGDFNERNVLVHADARVTLIDCDSMQVTDPASGETFLCTVGRPEFTPPELQQADWRREVRQASSDLFALAIHLHQLLLEGEHPFRGVWHGRGDKPSAPALARDGLWVHGGDRRLQPRPAGIDVRLLPNHTINLFLRALAGGATNPRERPTALEWQGNMDALAANLMTCKTDRNHRYPHHHQSCPWCTRRPVRRAWIPMACAPTGARLVGLFVSTSKGAWALSRSEQANGDERMPPDAGISLTGAFSISASYPGCTSCAAPSYVKCARCGRLSCWDMDPSRGPCGWCGCVGPVEGLLDTVDALDST